MKHDDAESRLFLAMLEYIYTDHTPPLEDTDVVSLMVLADRYGISRLVNLCEIFITKIVDKSCRKSIEKSDIDVIGLLIMSRVSDHLLLMREIDKHCHTQSVCGQNDVSPILYIDTMFRVVALLTRWRYVVNILVLSFKVYCQTRVAFTQPKVNQRIDHSASQREKWSLVMIN